MHSLSPSQDTANLSKHYADHLLLLLLLAELQTVAVLSQAINSFHITDYTTTSQPQHFFTTYLLGIVSEVESGFESVPWGQQASKYNINNLCIPVTLDKAICAGGKFTGPISLGWHYFSAMLSLLSQCNLPQATTLPLGDNCKISAMRKLPSMPPPHTHKVKVNTAATSNLSLACVFIVGLHLFYQSISIINTAG